MKALIIISLLKIIIVKLNGIKDIHKRVNVFILKTPVGLYKWRDTVNEVFCRGKNEE